MSLICFGKIRGGGIIAAHDWALFDFFSEKNIESENKGEGAQYTFLDAKRLLDFFMEHPNLWFVTDKIDDFRLLSELFFPLKNRMIVEVFSAQKYEEARQNGFVNIAYNVRKKQDFALVLERGYRLITISLKDVRRFSDELKELRKFDVKVMGYSAKSLEEVKRYQDVVDVFYYDGEDNLNAS